MERSSASGHPRNTLRFGLLTIATVALLSIVVGMILSSRLDLHQESTAQVGSNISQTGAFPVVDRGGRQESPFVEVVERVTNAVVNVSARQAVEEVPWWHQSSGLMTSGGSGFFFRNDGYVLTNNHVVKDAREVIVRTSTGYEYEAKVIGADPLTDLAVLKVEPEEPITVIPLGNSDDLKVGDWAIAIGNPFPQQGLDRTVTVGVISAIGRGNLQFGPDTPPYQNYIQTDAAVNPGNSGGPLLNLHGECVGINAAISTPTGSSVGISFAIPVNLAKAVVPDLIATGRVSRGWLGIWLSNITERQAKRLGLSAVRGVHIDSVFSGSPAAQAGLRGGDIITACNGETVNNAAQFSVVVSTIRAGTRVPIEINREGDKMTLHATLVDRDAFLASAPASPQPGSSRSQSWMGLELATFSGEMARDLGIRHVPGVYVVRVVPGTPGYRASIAEGTIITQIDGKAVETLAEFMAQARRLDDADSRVPLIVLEPDGTIARKVLRT